VTLNVAIFCFAWDEGPLDGGYEWWWSREDREHWAARNGPWHSPVRFTIHDVPENAPATEIDDAVLLFAGHVMNACGKANFGWEERDH
jgi:hypothetical protein